MKVTLCATAIDPDEIVVLSSKGDRYYSVTPPSLFNDAVCECIGYLNRGSCRHVTEVVNKQCRWRDLKGFKTCPDCGGEVIEFELEPEIG